MILVTGATGNVGRHLLAQLRAAGAADVRALVRPGRGKAAHRPDGVEVATGSSTVADLTGEPPHSFQQWARDHREAFR